jgi:hypothetical protein
MFAVGLVLARQSDPISPERLIEAQAAATSSFAMSFNIEGW